MTDSFSLPEFFAARDGERRAFADKHGHAGIAIVLLYEDMASRRFYRVGDTVLMDSLPDDHPHATLGHKLSDYIAIASSLRAKGIHTPEIYAADASNGFLLMEDLGDTPVSDARLEGAVDTLIRLRDAYKTNELGRPSYFDSHIHRARGRVVDWYMPCAAKRPNDPAWRDEYLALWEGILNSLPPSLEGFVHVDYHRGNLRALANGDVGILDFQDAKWGPLAYDLVNLLEDGRIRITPERKAELKARYMAGLDAAARDNFDLWYVALAGLFHGRVAGQFIKLVLAGKPRYAEYIPLAQAYMREDLSHPLLAPLKVWFDARGVTFAEEISLSGEWIGPEAF